MHTNFQIGEQDDSRHSYFIMCTNYFYVAQTDKSYQFDFRYSKFSGRVDKNSEEGKQIEDSLKNVPHSFTYFDMFWDISNYETQDIDNLLISLCLKHMQTKEFVAMINEIKETAYSYGKNKVKHHISHILGLD